MALDIPLYMENLGVPTRLDRNLIDAIFQKGVVSSGDLAVSVTGGLTLSIAAGQAVVDGTSVARQGSYHVLNDAAETLVLQNSDATNPRVDQVILRIYDAYYTGGTSEARFERLTGTPTAGATLDNSAGNTSRAALPPSSIRLSEHLIPANASTPSASRDRRSWARGASSWRADGDITVYSLNDSFHEAAVAQRIECSGAPLLIRAQVGGLASIGGGAPSYVAMPSLTVDSTNLNWNSADNILAPRPNTSYPASESTPERLTGGLPMEFVYTPTPGSHIFRLAVAASNVAGSAQYGWGPYTLSLRELPQNTNNGTS